MRLKYVASMGQSMGKHDNSKGDVLLDTVPCFARNSTIRIRPTYA